MVWHRHSCARRFPPNVWRAPLFSGAWRPISTTLPLARHHTYGKRACQPCLPCAPRLLDMAGHHHLSATTAPLGTLSFILGIHAGGTGGRTFCLWPLPPHHIRPTHTCLRAVCGSLLPVYRLAPGNLLLCTILGGTTYLPPRADDTLSILWRPCAGLYIRSITQTAPGFLCLCSNPPRLPLHALRVILTRLFRNRRRAVVVADITV